MRAYRKNSKPGQCAEERFEAAISEPRTQSDPSFEEFEAISTDAPEPIYDGPDHDSAIDFTEELQSERDHDHGFEMTLELER